MKKNLFFGFAAIFLFSTANADSTPPTCGTSLIPASWNNADVIAKIANCTDAESGCPEFTEKLPLRMGKNYNEVQSGTFVSSPNPFEKTLTTHGETFQATGVDGAGNWQLCSVSAAAQIDRFAPNAPSSLQISQTSLGFSSAAVSTSSSAPTVLRADSGALTFSFDVSDAAATATDGRSGLDFAASQISIQRTAPTSKTLTQSLADFSVNSEGANQVNLNSLHFDGENLGAFTQSGKYKVQLKIKDAAGNATDSSFFYVDVYPAAAAQDYSSFLLTCSGKKANGSDACTGVLTAKDEFQNPIFNRSFTGLFSEQDVSGSYDMLNLQNDLNQSAQVALENALRFGSGSFVGQNHTQTFSFSGSISSPGNGQVNSIEVKSLVPSGEILDSDLSDDAFLFKTSDRPIEFTFQSPEINPDGTAGSGTVDLTFVQNVNFAPWFDSFFTNNPDSGSTEVVDPFEILLEEAQSLRTLHSTGDSFELPNDFSINVLGHSRENTEFYDENLSENGGVDFDLAPSGNSVANPFETHLRGIGDEELTSGLSVAFSSQISIPVPENGATRNVRIPGPNFGNQVGSNFLFVNDARNFDIDETNIEGFTIGANISGNILTSGNSAIQTDSSAIDLGSIEVLDIREEITQNAYQLIRGRAPDSESTTLRNRTSDLADDAEILYYKDGTVILGSLTSETQISGVKTIVLEDANLLIVGDLAYQNPTDSLGIILINSEAGSKPETGNVFIYKNVQKLVGTYYADGSLTSTENNGGSVHPKMSDALDRESSDTPLVKQLLLEGTLLTKNTLGGSLLGEGALRNPWGPENSGDYLADLAESQKYDLHFIRRYYPKFEADGTTFTSETLDNCVLISGDQCDPDASSFLIRPDNRVQMYPPPGFEQ